jgi:release factor glutamine methyltransferase
MTVKDLLRETTLRLRSAGIEDPRVDSEILLAATLRIPRAHLPAIDSLSKKDQCHFEEWIQERSEKRTPVAHLIGECEFFGLPFRVSPDVLIPRPETEFLVERALARKERTFLDIGTGSGAIAVALATKGFSGIATDTSTEALTIARENAERNGVSSKIEFIEADLFAPGNYDLVLSNPPYIPSAEIETLSPEVRQEPKAALDGGRDGLDLIRKILSGTSLPLLMEAGAGQSQQITNLALQSGFSNVQWVKDLAGIDRILEVE